MSDQALCDIQGEAVIRITCQVCHRTTARHADFWQNLFRRHRWSQKDRNWIRRLHCPDCRAVSLPAYQLTYKVEPPLIRQVGNARQAYRNPIIE